MRDNSFKDLKKGRHDRYRGKNSHGPKTFRRGRAIAFLATLKLKRSTIKQQLDEPEFQSIQQILVGELKAIDMVINEFIQLFDIQEGEVRELFYKKNEEMEATGLDNEESLNTAEKGIEWNEPN